MYGSGDTYAERVAAEDLSPTSDPKVGQELEARILRTLILCDDAVWPVLESRGRTLNPEVFSSFRHQAVARAILAVRGKCQPLTGPSLLSALHESGGIQSFDVDPAKSEAEARDFIIQLVTPDWCFTPGLIDQYLDALYIASVKRDLASMAREAKSVTDLSMGTAVGFYKDIAARWDNMSPNHRGRLITAASGARAAVERIKAGDDASGVDSLPFRWPAYDARGVKIMPGQFVIVASRPGVGKSTWALRWAVDTATMTGRVVVFVSLEMTANECFHRAVLCEANVGDQQGKPITDPVILDKLDAAGRFIAEECKLLLCDNAPTTMDAFRSWLLETIKNHQPVAVVVDYLGLLTGRGGSTYEKVSDISRSLQQLAHVQKVPIVALHQFSRGMIHEKRPPTIADLRDSGQLEQDAHHIVLMDHPYARLSEREQQVRGGLKPYVIATLGKCRGGPSGIHQWLRMEGDRFRMTPTDRPTVSMGGGGT